VYPAVSFVSHLQHTTVKAGPIRRGEKPPEVQLYEVMATKLRIYFVMEYVRGGELFARVVQAGSGWPTPGATSSSWCPPSPSATSAGRTGICFPGK
jgi:hypothetical protein